MKKFQFLLLDAAPIIKLFEMGLWEQFIEKSQVTVLESVVDEVKWYSGENRDLLIDLNEYGNKGLITIEKIESFQARKIYRKYKLNEFRGEIHYGEEETLLFQLNHLSHRKYTVCASDAAVFHLLGWLGLGNNGISLEELLESIGIPQSKIDFQYTKKFRERYTKKGQKEFIQRGGF